MTHTDSLQAGLCGGEKRANHREERDSHRRSIPQLAQRNTGHERRMENLPLEYDRTVSGHATDKGSHKSVWKKILHDFD